MFTNIRLNFEKAWNEKKYWRRRAYIQNHHEKGGFLTSIYIMLVRRTEAKKNCTTGISLKGPCCQIDGPLILRHGLNGIVLAPNVHIGKNVTIYQHVTVSKDDLAKTTVIEDNVLIGAGAVIMKNVHIGEGARIGANAVVLNDVPAHATAVGVPARIINEEQ